MGAEFVGPLEPFSRYRRRAYPRMRRANPVGIVLSTGCRRVYECICGARHSESSKWGRTAHMLDFISAHNRECMPEGVTRG